MRVVVFSDSHGDINRCISVMEAVGKVDMIFHLGDIYRDVEDLKTLYPDIPIEFVIGNNDWNFTGERRKFVDVDGHKIMLTHGHAYRTNEELAKDAAENGAELALRGHTHQAGDWVGEPGGVHVLNVGSVSYPRGGEPCSCGILETENGRLKWMIFDYISGGKET